MAYFGRKTLLALAVAAATSHATAESLDVQGDTAIDVAPKEFAGVLLEGKAERKGDGIDFDAVKVNGDFVSNANFKLTGDFADAIGIDDDSGPSVISGSFVNNGDIQSTGFNASGIGIANTSIGDPDSTAENVGNVVNKGYVTVIDESGTKAEETIAGLVLEQVELSGDLINQGVIQVIANDAHGIKVDGTDSKTSDKLSRINRDVINSGTIIVRGDNGRGIELIKTILGADPEQVGTDILNSGSVQTTGANSVALRLDKTNFNRIINTGEISASGVNSVGIEVRESLSAQGADKGIVNEGDIYGSDSGIRIVNDLMNSDPGETSHENNLYRITQNSGRIGGGDSAIDGNFQTNLYLNGGEIVGDLEGIRQAFVNGSAVVFANQVEVNSFDVQSGSLNLTSNQTNFTGNLSVQKNANLVAFISDASNANNGLVSVEGTVTLENGSIVAVTTKEGDFTKNSNYVLISADKLVDLGATVKSATPLLKVSNVESNDSQLSADVALATGNEAWDGLEEIGVKQNGLVASRAFIDGVLVNLPTNSTLYQSFLNADNGQLRRLAEQLQPEINGGARAASVAATGLTSSALNSRAQALGANSGEHLVDTGAWVKVLDGRSDQGMRSGISGYDADSQGLIIGADGKINNQTTVGLAFSHVTTDVSSDNGNKTDVTTNALSAYGSWEDGPVSVNGSLTYGKSDNESKRYVGSDRLKADYDSTTLAADLRAGYSINLDDQFTVQPVAATRYTKVDIDGFSESGSAAALHTSGETLEVFEIGGGVMLDADFGAFKPTASVMAYRDLAQDKSQTSSAFVLGGNTFVTSGVEATPWTYEAGLGLEWSQDNYTVGASYDYTRKADFHASTTSLKARWDF